MIESAVILCGGLGTRLAEETKITPKPMVKIGKKPILCHIIDYYKFFGVKNFYLLTGYKSKFITDYFSGGYKKLNIKTIYTGKNSQTGGRLLRAQKFLKSEDNFYLTYGDGLSNVNLRKLYNLHVKSNFFATVTAVRPPLRFGELNLKKNVVKNFYEKTTAKESWISGGFFIFNYKIFDFLNNDATILEQKPIKSLINIRKLGAHKHNGFWQCMDTLREKIYLNKIWYKGKAPWKK